MSKNILDKKLVGRIIAESFLMGGLMATVSQVNGDDVKKTFIMENLSEKRAEEMPMWYRAIEAGDIEWLRELMNQGRVTGKTPKNAGFGGYAPLQTAMWFDEWEMVRRLLDHGVDINEQDNDDDETALHALIEILLEIGLGWVLDREILQLGWDILNTPEIDLTLRNNDGETAYGLARRLIMEKFLTPKDYEGWTAFAAFVEALRDATNAQLRAIGEEEE